jgi:hypothetical protein
MHRMRSSVRAIAYNYMCPLSKLQGSSRCGSADVVSHLSGRTFAVGVGDPGQPRSTVGGHDWRSRRQAVQRATDAWAMHCQPPHLCGRQCCLAAASRRSGYRDQTGLAGIERASGFQRSMFVDYSLCLTKARCFMPLAARAPISNLRIP